MEKEKLKFLTRSILKLIKYHSEKDEAAFKKEGYEVVKFFDDSNEHELGEYVMAQLADVNTFSPMSEAKT